MLQTTGRDDPVIVSDFIANPVTWNVMKLAYYIHNNMFTVGWRRRAHFALSARLQYELTGYR